ncbi:MAG: lyase family protein [Alphaproteobacteria bacterium]|nr:lyase family protein [Alphaproteobacteria bacterium]
MSTLDALLPAYLSDLLGDAEIAAEIDGLAQLAAMLRVEAALAAAQAEVGALPAQAARAIEAAAARLAARIDPADLAEATARDGVPVPALVALLREEAGAAAPAVHSGATSQDVVDTAWALCLKPALAILDGRLLRIGDALAALAAAHKATPMAARTRTQQAVPTRFGLAAAQWFAPFAAHRAALRDAGARACILSLGGAAGTQAAFGPTARAVEEAMARRLDLGVAELPWHSRREGGLALGAALAGAAASCGKIAQDLLLLARTEVGEVGFTDAGGSSAMPHKANPVAAEAALALARHAGALQAALHQAAMPADARDGAAWAQEWLAFAPLLLAVGACLARTERMLETLEVRPARMRANLVAFGSPTLAEAAGRALAATMAPDSADALLRRALAEAAASGDALSVVLKRLAPEAAAAAVDWAALDDPVGQAGEADAMIARALAAWAASR